MARPDSPALTLRRGASVPRFRLRIGHLALLNLYVAIVIVNIQDQHCEAPALIALATTGFVGYALLAWLGWRFARRFEARLGPMPVLILYLSALAGLFLVATVVYLTLEFAYLTGHLGF